MRTRFLYGALAFLLTGTVTVDAATDVLLYNVTGAAGQSNYPRRRSQHFSATQSTPNSVAPGYLFNAAAMQVDVAAGSTWKFILELYRWDTDYATTLVPANLLGATSETTVSGETKWLIVDMSSNPQDVSGQYLLSLNVTSGDSTPCNILNYDGVGNGGTNNDAFTDATLRTDREFNVRLTVYPNPACVTPFTITAVTKPDGSAATFSRPPSPGVQRLKAVGTGLNNVNSVTIQQGLATPISGSIVSKTATELQADFDMTPTTVTPGTYKMIAVGGPSNACIYQYDSAVTITCSQPDTAISEIQNGAGLTGTSAHTMTLVGTNLSYLAGTGGSTVKLVKARGTLAQIPGNATYDSGTTNLNVVFNLTGAEGGLYNIVLTRNVECGAVTSEIPLSGARNGFLVYMPALTGGGFEEGYTTDPTTGSPCDSSANDDRPMAKNWDEGWSPDGHVVRDGSQYKPCETNPTPPPATILGGVTGSHYTSVQYIMGDFKIISFFQTIAAPDVTTKDYEIFADISVQSVGQLSEGRIRLIDGNQAGTLINGVDIAPTTMGGTTLMNTDLIFRSGSLMVRDSSFTAKVSQGYTWTSNPPLLTIEFMFIASGGETGSKALLVDAVRNTFVPPPDCNNPRDDSDGDGDVDLIDFGQFQACFNGPNRPYALPSGFDQKCKCMDINGDNDVDLEDFGKFQACFNGPNRPPNAGCGG